MKFGRIEAGHVRLMLQPHIQPCVILVITASLGCHCKVTGRVGPTWNTNVSNQMRFFIFYYCPLLDTEFYLDMAVGTCFSSPGNMIIL
jgi:hypothetical protein